MANPLYQELNRKVNAQDALRELKSNPAQLIKQAGYNVPANIANNPQATVMHLLQSGQVSNPMMNMLMRMMGRK
jgi:hypothetical protein